MLTHRTLSEAAQRLPASSGNWRRSLAAAIRDPDELISELGLSDSLRQPAHSASQRFPLLVPRSYLRRIEPGNASDPLLLQVLPLGAELVGTPGFTSDPVGDTAARTAPGLLQKYHGRALLITTGKCAVHCRYCFRREYPYGQEPRQIDDWTPALDAVRHDSAISEVILSGGDPLVLADGRLADLVDRLSAIEHVQRFRLHSRLPIVLPDRVTMSLLDVLRSSRLTPVMVVHANHPNEIVADCADALRLLVQSGITTLNQSVLLAGVNDTIEALEELSLRLINVGVIPYYLHQLDRVVGSAHFEATDEVGLDLINALRSRLPGYAVPKFVQETAGAPGKRPVAYGDTASD